MKCSLSKAPKNADDSSFRKPIESEFNFGSSIPEKNLVKQKNIHMVDDDSSLPVCIKNLIINKLYDECSDNFDSKQFVSIECGNSCKSYVDIIDDGHNDKIRINVKDCDCRENKKNKMLNYLDRPSSIVENPGYDAACKINKLGNISEQHLTKKDLLSFALQIATGMVSCMQSIFFGTFILIFNQFRSFCRSTELFIVIWLLEMFAFAMTIRLK